MVLCVINEKMYYKYYTKICKVSNRYITHMLSIYKRPVCQTGLCAEMKSCAIQKSPLSNRDFDIQEANNVTLLEDADA